ncbi:tetratricopeptide repeat protein [Halomonas sp. V046]|uniref:tetratricopeptide repeat protein n=1 Tax=Halomonas sp. V046 TaxID=3459611 RepID=UPI004043CD66
MVEKLLDSRCFYKVAFLLCLFSFGTPSAFSEVIYSNPVENEYGQDLKDSSLEELLFEASDQSGGEQSVKANYLLGIIFINGDEKWGVRRDFNRGRGYLLDAWEDGAADAGYTLASIYLKGVGVEVNHGKSLMYLRKSAEMGLLLSQRALGRACLGGSEQWSSLLEMNVEKGLFWLEMAANSGDIKSAMSLASVYAQGELVDRDFEAARAWAYKWSESRYGVDVNAFEWLARFYERGLGTEKDLVQAYKYYDLIDPSGADDKARLAEEMTSEQISEAIRQSREWQEEHNIFVPSYYNLEHQADGSFR